MKHIKKYDFFNELDDYYFDEEQGDFENKDIYKITFINKYIFNKPTNHYYYQKLNNKKYIIDYNTLLFPETAFNKKELKEIFNKYKNKLIENLIKSLNNYHKTYLSSIKKIEENKIKRENYLNKINFDNLVYDQLFYQNVEIEDEEEYDIDNINFYYILFDKNKYTVNVKNLTIKNSNYYIRLCDNNRHISTYYKNEIYNGKIKKSKNYDGNYIIFSNLSDKNIVKKYFKSFLTGLKIKLTYSSKTSQGLKISYKNYISTSRKKIHYLETTNLFNEFLKWSKDNL